MPAGWYMTDSLECEDDEVLNLCKLEKERQLSSLELIASENFTSRACLEALSSSFHNKYSEGYPGARYYGGNEHVDDLERLCWSRALQVFHVSPTEWGVNVQPYSGTPANFEVYSALVGPGGRIMGLDLPDGGHLSHGYYTQTRKVSASSVFFQSFPYKVSTKTGLIDYERLAENARLFKPHMIVAGTSCYPRHLDYARFREICDDVGALLMSDMAHISGLVAAGLTNDPFKYSDIVTTTTHKTLRCARGAMIFFRRGEKKKGGGVYDFEGKINAMVFPGLQGGPHNHQTAGIAVGLKQALKPEFVDYQKQVVENARTLAAGLVDKGYEVVTGGTDTHLVLLDLRPLGINGSRVDLLLEMMHISTNKNTCPGDKSALNPSGIRLGTPALTSRNFVEADFKRVADFMDEGIQLALRVNGRVKESTGKEKPTLAEFKAFLATDESTRGEAKQIGERVSEFARKFPMPGYAGY